MLHSFQQEKYWPAEHEIKDKEPLLTQLLWPHRDFIAEWLKWGQWLLNWSNHLHQKQWREGNLLKCYRYNQRYFTGELPFSAILYFYSTTLSDCLSYFIHSHFVEHAVLVCCCYFLKKKKVELHWFKCYEGTFFLILKQQSLFIIIL